MLSKKERLAVQDFKGRKVSKQLRDKYFLLKIFDAEAFGAGVILSKKVSPLASTRNKIKREIFDFFSDRKDELDSRKAYIVIASVNCRALAKEKGAIVKHLEKLLLK